jgi:light-regulated signal transduction histidine kinase (bacteriophytochrome)
MKTPQAKVLDLLNATPETFLEALVHDLKEQIGGIQTQVHVIDSECDELPQENCEFIKTANADILARIETLLKLLTTAQTNKRH